MRTTVVVEKCGSYDRDEVLNAVRHCVDQLGGMSRFVKPGQKVLLKPNLLTVAPPEKAVLTHPEFVRAAAILAQEAGGEVILGDSPGIATLARVLADSDYHPFMRELGIEAQPFEEMREVKTGLDGILSNIEISTVPLDVDVVINLPKLKTHALMYMTLAVKNLFGCVAGKKKTQWHFKANRNYEQFGMPLVQIARAVSPALTILDGIVGMEGNGPYTGTPRRVGAIVAGTDCVAVDAVVCEMLYMDQNLLCTHKAAREIGWGVTEVSEIEIRGRPLEDMRVDDFKSQVPINVPLELRLPLEDVQKVCFSPSKVIMLMPMFVRRRLRRFFTPRPRINVKTCKMCGVCKSICPAEAMRMDRKVTIDNDKCIQCFCCQEVCPYGAIDVQDGLFGRILSRGSMLWRAVSRRS